MNSSFHSKNSRDYSTCIAFFIDNVICFELSFRKMVFIENERGVYVYEIIRHYAGLQ